MSETVTDGIRIKVVSAYVPERSNPRQSQYFFIYRVRISNEGSGRVHLVSRHWVITDADGHTEEVRGPGVVGETPTLAHGEDFEYTSFCPLSTPVGTMHGSFKMMSASGNNFDAKILPFRLAVARLVN